MADIPKILLTIDVEVIAEEQEFNVVVNGANYARVWRVVTASEECGELVDCAWLIERFAASTEKKDKRMVTHKRQNLTKALESALRWAGEAAILDLAQAKETA